MTRRGASCLALLLAISFRATGEEGKEAATGAPPKIVEFPDDLPVGVIQLRPTGDSTLILDLGKEKWIQLGQQIGEAKVPADRELVLTLINPGGVGAEYRELAKLAPDAVQCLVFNSCPNGDDDLRHVRGLTGLIEVCIEEGEEVTDAGMEHLAGLPNLRFLSLNDCSITDAGLASLTRIKSLRGLSVGGYRSRGAGPPGLTGAGLAALRAWPDMEWLYLSGVARIGEGAREIGALKHLRAFYAGAGLGDADLAELEDLTKLEYLSLGPNVRITDAGLAHLKGMTSMKALSLAGTGVKGPGLASLRGFARMHSLHLNESALEPGGLAHLHQLPSLWTLFLSRTAIGDGDLAALVSCKKLENLHLESTNITDAGMAHLGKMRGLKHLVLGSNSLTNVGVESLLPLDNLEMLQLGDTRVTDRGVQLAAKLPKLRYLQVEHLKLNPKTLSAIRDERPELSIHWQPPLRTPAPPSGGGKPVS